MSPFASTPELWLSGHLQRLHQEDQAVKIQAVVRGFLLRRHQEKERKANKLYNDVIQNLMVRKQRMSLVKLMQQLDLYPWVDFLPSAKDAVMDPYIGRHREEILWNAKISLRLTGQSSFVQDIEWTDYFERYDALQDLQKNPPVPQPSTFWSRLIKFIWG